ncbi:MAG: flagellar M-ring protein FliF C-terminal domain-containing protein [Lachnospiraceae bacterium]|nr:flagellar M-ring protein FliF C-terminal domain-containing protein [Lachnospiraceae bacterium]
MQERIVNRLREIIEKIKEWWNRFSSKQKTIIVGIAAAILMAFVILIVVLTRPTYVLLLNCEDTREASEVTALLDDNEITYTITDDGLTISVLESQQSDANLLLGANDIQSSAYSIDNVTNGGFSTTESDKQKRYIVYLQSRLERDFIGKFNAISSAHVELNIPENDGTLIAENKESSAAIILELQDEFTADQAAYLAQAVATALGSTDASNITIMDTDGNMLFSGADNYSVAGSANSQLSVKAQAENMVKSEVKQVLLNTNLYDQIEVASNLAIDFSTSERTDHNYTPAEGQTQGVYSQADEYSSDSTSGSGNVPGTDTNQNDTSYVFENDNESSTSTTENSYKFLPNESIISQNTPAGSINYGNSSVSVTAIAYNVIREEDARSQGLLDGISWDDYKAANSERTKLDVDEDLFSVVSNATGISTNSISILAYEENLFLDRSGSGIGLTDILQIALIVIILGLLAFVVLRSMRREREPEQEEELSVENMLQSTPMEEIEDIELETKSETRKMIEKFVDENPEAAANLLRNWLNEDWG